MKKLTDNQTEIEDYKGYLVEIIGTFTLTFVSCWTIVSTNLFQNVYTSGYLLISLAPALVYFVFLNLGGQKSMTSMNPALTFAMMILKKQSWSVGIRYILLQLTGAIIAAGFIFIELSKSQYDSLAGMSILGIPSKGFGKYENPVIIGEFIGSLFLGFAYTALFASENSNKSERIAAGSVSLILFVCLFSLNEVYGVGLNPARSIGPAIISGKFSKLQFDQIIGPLFGCLLGAVLQNSIYVTDEEEDMEEEDVMDEAKDRLKNEKDLREIELEEVDRH